MPKAHQRHGSMTPESLITRAARTGYHTAALVERLMRDGPHPEQGYRSSLGVLSLLRQFGADRLEAACARALTVGAVSYASVRSILVTGLDQAPESPEPITATPAHDNIRRARGAPRILWRAFRATLRLLPVTLSTKGPSHADTSHTRPDGRARPDRHG